MTQRDRVRCDRCGGMQIVTPTPSPWEFAMKCECGESHWISWAHANPPPTFQHSEPQQQELFDAVMVQ